MKIVIAPDSFKGSLSAPKVAEAIAKGWRRVYPEAHCVCLPVADGGEGTLDALLTATGGQSFDRTVTGPLGSPVSARWGLLGDRKTAVVELAQAAGLTLVPSDRRDPKITTTRGVGELLKEALTFPGVGRVVVALGGSATNDGGAGLLEAFGVSLRDAEGHPLSPGGAELSRLATVDHSTTPSIPDVDIWVACDVDNPLTGPRGASAVFGPQKGGTPEDITKLDAALAHYAALLAPEAADTPGAGAAGGTAFGLLALFPHTSLRPGIDLVLDAVGFDTHLEGAHLVLTGEGRLDAQTLGGKAIAGVAKRARKAGVPTAALVGGLDPTLNLETLTDQVGVAAVLPIPPGPVSLENAITNAATYISDSAERAARWYRLGQSFRLP